MPSVGMRRSTRVFVPKSVGKDGDLGKVLRSGKRLFPESDDEKRELGIAFYKSNGWRKVLPDLSPVTPKHGKKVPSLLDMPSSVEDSTRYSRVYGRKRKRRGRSCGSSGTSSGRLLGSFYVRKRLKNSDSPSSSSSDSHSSGLSLQLFGQERVSALDVIVDFSPCSQWLFMSFFVSVLRFMRSSYVALSGLAAFLCCGPIGDVFSRHGVHFRPVFSPRVTLANDTVSSGLCRIYGYHSFVPLVWLDFSAAPLFFRSLYSIVFVRSLYIPTHVLPCLTTGLPSEDHEVFEGGIGLSSENHEVIEGDKSSFCRSIVIALPQSNSMSIGDSYVNKDMVVEGNGVRVFSRRTATRNIRRKKRSLRPRRAKSSCSLGLRPAVPFKPSSQIKTNSSKKNSCRSGGLDAVEIREGGCSSLAVSVSNQKQTDIAQRNAIHDLKEVKSESVGLGHNIDTLHCNANILVIEADRCYREEGATIMLECSTSNVWNVVVKAHGVTKYVHQAEEVMKPGATNRFTHAMIWTVENGWKLEFFDRRDWFIFKELHKECARRNIEVNSARTIPVPGVREIPQYDDGEHVAFSRPVSYITFYSNEVARALAKKSANYDIDPDDEEWLGKLNSGLVLGELDFAEHLTADKLEEIIDVLEKYAYRNPSDVSDEGKMTSVCSNLGRGDIIAAVYKYWLRKRKQKRAALLRVFECQPPRKAPAVPENIHRRKRSFKKHASQNGRSKQQPCFEGDYILIKGIGLVYIQCTSITRLETKPTCFVTIRNFQKKKKKRWRFHFFLFVWVFELRTVQNASVCPYWPEKCDRNSELFYESEYQYLVSNSCCRPNLNN